jgi:uncharacterized protein YjbI with pentapeptide repeats
MKAWLRSWWKNTSKVLKVLQIFALAVVIFLIVSLFGGYFGGWTWTGFGPYTPPTSDFQRGVTLYDWLQLFFIPAAIAFGVVWFSRLQQQRDQQLADQRAQTERDAAEKRAQIEREAAEKQAQTERDIAKDNQREQALQDYIDSMSALLLDKDLSKSDENAEVRTIARVRTLAVLRRLDGRRKGTVLNFLHESGLIDKDQNVIDLVRADLSGASLIGAFLIGAELHATNLREARLIGANLTIADLKAALLDNADLRMATLKKADLSLADLIKADLSLSYLDGAIFDGAVLSEANLTGVHDITIEELEKQVKSLKGATMPDGTKHD